MDDIFVILFELVLALLEVILPLWFLIELISNC